MTNAPRSHVSDLRGVSRLAPMLGHMDSSLAREAVIAALNGVLGDHLIETGNPLEPTRAGLAAAFPVASTKITVLVHGLCMNDLQWTRQEHNHGAALAFRESHKSIAYDTGHLDLLGRPRVYDRIHAWFAG